MSRLIQYVTFATALGCGLSAGVFFAFSSFVMPALDRLAPGQSIRAMNSINKLALTPVFMTALIGTAVACAVLGVWAVVSWGERPAALVLAGSALYLLGAIVVTKAANVPLNDALMSVDPDGADAADALEQLPRRLDGVEPRARRQHPGRVGTADRRAARQSLTA